MIDFNLLERVTFMNTISLLRSAFLALSLSAFLTSNAFAASAEERGGEQGRSVTSLIAFFSRNVSSEDNQAGMASALVPYAGIAQDDDHAGGGGGGAAEVGGAGGAVDTPFITATEGAGTPTLVSLLRADHPDAQIDLERLDQKDNAFVMLPDELIHKIISSYLSVHDGVALRETCYALYHALSDTRFDRAFNYGRMLHHIVPAQRSPEFAKGAADLPLCLRKKDIPSIFIEDISRLDLSGYTHALPEGLLEGSANLESLTLNNHTHALPEGLLDGATNLQYLRLNNHQHPISAGLLDGARALRWLFLSGHTHALPEGFLTRGVPNLRTLRLRHHTQPLPAGLIEGLRAQGVTVHL